MAPLHSQPASLEKLEGAQKSAKLTAACRFDLEKAGAAARIRVCNHPMASSQISTHEEQIRKSRPSTPMNAGQNYRRLSLKHTPNTHSAYLRNYSVLHV